MLGYSVALESRMVRFYGSLSEKDRRRYASLESEKLGQGGVKYIADLFGCDPDTIRHGSRDIEQLPEDEAPGRVRKKGGSEAS